MANTVQGDMNIRRKLEFCGTEGIPEADTSGVPARNQDDDKEVPSSTSGGQYKEGDCDGNRD